MSNDRTERVSPKEERAQRKAKCARRFAKAVAESPHTVTVLAARSGTSDTKYREYMDDSGGADLPAHEYEVVPEEIWLPLARHDARAHWYTLVQLPMRGTRATDELAMLASAAKETAEAVGAHAEALRDPSKAALEKVVKETTEALEAIAALRERALEAIAELAATPIRRSVR